MITDLTKFILYACPGGELGEQIEAYFSQSRGLYGANTAHQYMPHCTLTGFFEDQPEAVEAHVQALKSALAEQLPHQPIPVAEVCQLSFQSDWYGLELKSPWLQAVARAFAVQAVARAPLRLKTWLHISLAYGFEPDQAEGLKQLALELVDPKATAAWDLRLYQRQSDWYCHYDHTLTTP